MNLRISENTSLNWRVGSPIGMTTERMMTKRRTGCSFLADPENTSAQESERQVHAPCVAGLLSQIALCVSNTGDIIIQTRT
jgi:hypothetical protein